jgi:hypothetical protein
LRGDGRRKRGGVIGSSDDLVVHAAKGLILARRPAAYSKIRGKRRERAAIREQQWLSPSVQQHLLIV